MFKSKAVRIPVLILGIIFFGFLAYADFTKPPEQEINSNNFNTINDIPQNINTPEDLGLNNDGMPIDDANPNLNQARELLELIPQQIIVPQSLQVNTFSQPRTLNAPKNFKINVFAANLTKPRFIDFDENNNMYVVDSNLWTVKANGGEVLLIRDVDNDGFADQTSIIDKNLNNPHGIDYYKGDLYVAEEGQVVVYRNINGETGQFSNKQVLVTGLPTGTIFSTGSGHVTRTIKIGPDEKLYVSVGSLCNVCQEENELRATILRYDLNGNFEDFVGRGLRNSVGFVFYNDPNFGTEIWSVDNGRDRIGDDLPPEEVNIIPLDASAQNFPNNFGWPYCYGQGITNPEFTDFTEFCQNQTFFPKYEMQAHSAPLGINFYPSTASYFDQRGPQAAANLQSGAINFPKTLEKNAFIGFHGSWNRSVPTGYKIVRLDTNSYFNNPTQNSSLNNANHYQQTLPNKPVNFITGWLQSNGQDWGRPVEAKFDNNGVMYITDDKAGAIYRVTYTGN